MYQILFPKPPFFFKIIFLFPLKPKQKFHKILIINVL
jgi:hypothetical protein